MKQERVTTKDTIAESFDQLILAVGQQKRFFATAEEIAPFLDTDAAILINIAKRDPDYLGFPICFLGDYLRIPIIPFLKWATGASFKHLMGAVSTVQKPHEYIRIENNESSKLITFPISKDNYERLQWVAEKTNKNPIELISRAARMWIRSKYRIMNPPMSSDIQL